MTDPYLAMIAETDFNDRPALMYIGRAMSENPGLCMTVLGDESTSAIGRQALSVWRYELEADCPQKLWRDADRSHPAIARALRVDPSDPASFYALFPFRLGKIDDEYRILVAYHPPEVLSGNWCHLDINTVLSWDPKANTVSVLDDVQPQVIIGGDHEAELTVYGDPFLFFRALVEQRAAWHMRRMDANAGKWVHPCPERPADLPGALIIGEIRDIRWPIHELPPVLNCVGCSRGAVTNSIFRSANIPDVVDANQKAAA